MKALVILSNEWNTRLAGKQDSQSLRGERSGSISTKASAQATAPVAKCHDSPRQRTGPGHERHIGCEVRNILHDRVLHNIRYTKHHHEQPWLVVENPQIAQQQQICKVAEVKQEQVPFLIDAKTSIMGKVGQETGDW